MRVMTRILRSALGLVLGAGLVLLAGAASAQTVVRGPYLQTGTPQSVIVRWRTDSTTNAVVRYGVDPANLNFSATVSTSDTDHEVALSGHALQVGAHDVGQVVVVHAHVSDVGSRERVDHSRYRSRLDE